MRFARRSEKRARKTRSTRKKETVRRARVGNLTTSRRVLRAAAMVRFKNRYLLAEFRWHDARVDDSLTDNVLVGVLRQGLALNFGDVAAGAALGSLSLKYWNAVTGLAVVRCGRDIHREVWATMTLMREVKGRSVVVRVLHNGSTLRSSQRSALARSEEAFARLAARGAMPGGERAATKGAQAAGRAIEALQP